MTEDLVTADALELSLHLIHANFIGIIHPSTANATHMAVSVRITVESGFRGTDLEFLDDPGSH